MTFDPCGPLPSGVTVLEASAGTGKTFTIAALAARYVAQGVPLDQLLLVTFTRMATSELRERVRDRLVRAERGLGGESDDELVRLLASGDGVALRRERLQQALAGFDAATIATTHSFCQEVLGSLGVLGDVEPGTTLVEDLADLRREVVEDLYVRRFHRHGQPQFPLAEAMGIARAALDNPDAPVEPADAPETSVEAMRVRLAVAAREELERRKRRMALMTYDDLQTRLDEILSGPYGDDAVARIRDRYRVVLVDEFQDTDPVQWRILQRAFGGGRTTLVLIGDPKQAIYAFRGADVYAYLDAARAAGTRETLGTNRRSDAPLLCAYDALFGDARLGHEGIAYRRVEAAAGARMPGPPLRVRVVPRLAVGVTPRGWAKADAARAHIARDLAGDVVRTLRSEDVRPGDVAVLTRTNRGAARVRDALSAVGVPAVINGAGSVLGTEPAAEWLRLLEAIERPSHPGRVRAAALTCFLGWDAARVAGADDAAWEAVHQRLHHWARVLREAGVASLLEAATLEERLPARVLGLAGGERRLTDLRHVGELLHGAATTEGLGTAALTGWLRERIRDAATDVHDEDRSRRLESDAEAVQVLTVHRSKGLEFPVVYYPDLWEPSPVPRPDRPAPVVFHDDAGRRTIDVGLGGPHWTAHVRRATEEQRGEDLRLAYVALTRARHRAVVWWAGSFESRCSALTRLLCGGEAKLSDEEALARFGSLACTSVARAEVADVEPWSPVEPAGAGLSVARFDRSLDHAWRRTSFSALTAGLYEARVGSEPEEPVVDDERARPVAAVAEPDDELRAVPSRLASMPVGAGVGTLVHRVLETADFTAPDLEAELADAAALGPDVVAGLAAALSTPLGPAAGGLRLRDFARADRLDELTFELPLVGGDAPRASLTLSAIAELAGEDALAGLDLDTDLRGYLTGTVDCVLRLPDGRFAIADYKTNWLAPPGEDLTAWHHRPAALRAEMEHANYGLQALLYVVALHRFLRWRVAGYTAATHLAGVLYLFLRGMTGPGTPVVDGHPCGVHAWQPAPELVEALSDAFDRGAPG